MTPALAALPLLLVLLAMGAGGLSAAKAGAIGLALALALALLAPGFGFDGALDPALAGSAAEAGFSALTILWIIFPALALYEYQSRTGAIERIRDALTGLTSDRRLQAVLIAWFFGLFIEGAAGFGTPVALAAPLLAGLGYPPVRAVAIALLGHAAGVSFGAVGTPTLAQVDLTDLAPTAISGPVATMHAVVGPLLLLAALRLAGDGPLSGHDLRWGALAAVCFFVPSLAIAWVIGPELPSLGGAFIGGAVFVWLLLRAEHGRPPDLRALLPDLMPYLLILALVLLTRLVGPLTEAVRAPAIAWELSGGFEGRFEPLYHPGTLLLAGLGISAAFTGRLGPAREAVGPRSERHSARGLSPFWRCSPFCPSASWSHGGLPSLVPRRPPTAWPRNPPGPLAGSRCWCGRGASFSSSARRPPPSNILFYVSSMDRTAGCLSTCHREPPSLRGRVLSAIGKRIIAPHKHSSRAPAYRGPRPA